MAGSSGGVDRLLIVDDDALMRGLAARTLRHAGFDVTEAAEGPPALEMFERTPFDLVLLDVMMPGMDGFEVCAHLRRLPGGARVPVLMLTGLNDTASIEQAYQAGATDFIAKPINWALLSHRVRYALRAGAAVEAAIKSRERLERAHLIAHMGSWEMRDGEASFVCSPELARVLGAGDQTAPMVLGNEEFLARVDVADRETVRAARQSAQRDGWPYQLTYGIERFDGVQRTVLEQAAAVLDSSGLQIAVEGITQDVTDRVEAERRISQLAHYDVLTGLPNRNFFGELVEQALERTRRHDGSCAMLHVDIDRFKSVNDAYGLAEGDQVLVTMAERLRGAIRVTARSADQSSAAYALGDSMVARVGANAFTLLLVDIGSAQQATTVGDRLLDAVAAPIALHDRELVLTASIGIALFPRDAADATALARCAEQAGYAAKAAGGARHRFFDEAINAQASARLARETDLRNAIAQGQLRLHYQPKIDAASGRVTGAEALVRWQHPERGLVPPGQFIPLAEETGLILPLTDWVLEAACGDLRRRIDDGLTVVPVSVNLASPSFMKDDLLAQLDALLERHRLSTGLLMLEVTESLLMSDVDRAVARLHELRERGLGLSLDDFGTGYSSMSYLKRFPIDELKIDRSFIVDAHKGGRDGAIAASIIALGREFGLRVVAEGVETAQQSSFLLRHGCAHQQGFLFARPMPTQAFDELMRSGGVAPAGGPASRPAA